MSRREGSGLFNWTVELNVGENARGMYCCRKGVQLMIYMMKLRKKVFDARSRKKVMISK